MLKSIWARWRDRATFFKSKVIMFLGNSAVKVIQKCDTGQKYTKIQGYFGAPARDMQGHQFVTSTENQGPFSRVSFSLNLSDPHVASADAVWPVSPRPAGQGPPTLTKPVPTSPILFPRWVMRWSLGDFAASEWTSGRSTASFTRPGSQCSGRRHGQRKWQRVELSINSEKEVEFSFAKWRFQYQ